jgi:gamma-glutamyltranspeptidase/glutathione hydrolase
MLVRTEKRPATADRGMVVTNHPRASAAGAEMLLAGGNAIDAAIASLFALTVVEPMMVGVLGGGVAHVRLADGTHHILDGLSTAPAAARATMFAPVGPGLLPADREVKDRANALGARAVAVPGALPAWCAALDRFGTMPLADVIAPAIRLARDGFVASPYLADCVSDSARDIARDRALAALFLPGGVPIKAGDRLAQGAAADALSLIARDGPAALTEGAIGTSLVDALARGGGVMRLGDLAAYRVESRQPVVGQYRGHAILGPPPPASAGLHIAQMLNILEGFDVARLGFGTVDGVHLLAEAMKIAFADRAVATADPAFVAVPVEALLDKRTAAARRAALRMDVAQAWGPAIAARESANTTHVTVADAMGNVVASTQTINGLFGACLMVPETGLLTNNYMFNFDPHPGRALSIAPGKRCFTSMAPMMATRDGRLVFALGLPGGLRIFPSALQAIVNLIDHGMDAQSAVEAPRVWCEGGPIELEPGIAEETAAGLAARGHALLRVNRVAGGMSAITIDADGVMTGAACWRADGTPVGIAGGAARAGVRFSGA